MKNLKVARVLRGITQEELSERMGVAKNTISRWERGECNITAENIRKLCEILNFSSDFILGITDKY